MEDRRSFYWSWLHRNFISKR